MNPWPDNRRYCVHCVALLLVTGVNAATAREQQGDESGWRYSTREEQREAGLDHELTPWLTASGLLEWEEGWQRLSGTTTTEDTENEVTAQLGVTIEPGGMFKGEAVLEYDSTEDRLFFDESVLILDMESLELSVGTQYLPFGIYFSQFATAPLLEFGETRADAAATLTYDLDDRFELSLSAYRGSARESGKRSRDTDWALGAGAWITDDLKIGVGYLSDLADADSRLLEDEDNRFTRKVPAATAHVIWAPADFELSFEALSATRSFAELESDRNRPMAWNLEYANFSNPAFDWALRVEGSDELEDAPEIRYGASLTVQLDRRMFFKLDYLRGQFKDELATDDDDNVFDKTNQVRALLSVTF